MCLPWTVHDWIAEVANNPLVIDFVLDRFHTTTELDLTTGIRLRRVPFWMYMESEPEPEKEPETIKEEPKPKKRRKEPETTKEEP